MLQSGLVEHKRGHSPGSLGEPGIQLNPPAHQVVSMNIIIYQ